MVLLSLQGPLERENEIRPEIWPKNSGGGQSAVVRFGFDRRSKFEFSGVWIGTRTFGWAYFFGD